MLFIVTSGNKTNKTKACFIFNKTQSLKPIVHHSLHCKSAKLQVCCIVSVVRVFQYQRSHCVKGEGGTTDSFVVCANTPPTLHWGKQLILLWKKTCTVPAWLECSWLFQAKLTVRIPNQIDQQHNGAGLKGVSLFFLDVGRLLSLVWGVGCPLLGPALGYNFIKIKIYSSASQACLLCFVLVHIIPHVLSQFTLVLLQLKSIVTFLFCLIYMYM